MATDVLANEVARRTQKGWQVVSQAANGVQLKKPKHFSFLWGAFWFIFGLGFGFILYLIWHWAKKDNFVFLSVNSDGTLAVSESKGFLATIGSWLSGYWRWGMARPAPWQKVAAIGGPILVVILIIVAASASGSSGSKKDTAVAASGGTTKQVVAPTIAPAPTAPVYKFRVTKLTCSTDSLNDRTCTGTVTNISPLKITDARPVVHWTGGTDSDLGEIAINPVLPGQTSDFTVYTLNANPALTAYTIGFKKIFGDESDFPVEPLAP
jgi:hypothetical protein